MNTFKRLRIHYTLTTTLVAAVFLAIVFGGLVGLMFASNSVMSQRTLERALEEYSQSAPSLSPEHTCIIIYTDGSGAIRASSNIDYYEDYAEQIAREAIKTGSGRFKVGGCHFAVEQKALDGGTLYAVIDRTMRREELIDTVLQVALLYACSIGLVGIIAYILSAKTLRPIGDMLKKQRDLIANASHELKTPLTIISTNLDVIKSEPATSVTDNEKWLASITAQIERMQGLIQNMLELSRLEQSQLPYENTDMSQITEGACLAFEAVCFEKQVRLICEIQPDITVSGDKNALERLVVILLDNAIKYSGENGKIGCRLSADGKKMRLSVMNTGEVISKEDEKHVFDRFYRSDGARQHSDKQSFGLGLSIAAATVQAHGGKIMCHGIEDKGTVFEVILPMLRTKKPKKLKTPKSE